MLRRNRLTLETLESRVVPSADLVGGVLTVVGSKAADVIQVRVETTNIVVDVNGQVSSFDLNDVHELYIKARKGGDDVTVETEVEIEAEIHGGKGRDSIEGGSGDDSIYGGRGDDSLEGGAGNDDLYGEDGDDDLYGGDDDDYCHGGAGDDDAFGGSGDDDLRGGRGDDDLDGEDGFDISDGGKGRDHSEDSFELENEYRALLGGLAGGFGEAEFENEQEGSRTELNFKVEVEDLVPNQTVDVYVDGALVTQLTVDDRGDARVEFSTHPDAADGELPFPDGFPVAGEGSVVSIRVGADVILEGTLHEVPSDT